MTVVAFASTKASPGVTTTVVAAGHVWPAQRSLVVVEADPAGGDLAARHGVPVQPGLASLAAAGRRALSPELVANHTQRVGGLPVVVAPPTATPTRAALEVLGTPLGPALARMEADVLVDLGRLDPGSPALPLARGADLLVVVARPTIVELPRVTTRVAELAAEGCRLALVLVGEMSPLHLDRYPAGEVADVVDVPVLGTLADDTEAAALLAGRATSARSLARSLLVRSARDVVDALVAHLSAADASGEGWPAEGRRADGPTRVEAAGR